MSAARPTQPPGRSELHAAAADTTSSGAQLCRRSRPRKAAGTRRCRSHHSFYFHSSAQTAARGIPTPVVQGSVIPHLAGKDAGNPGGVLRMLVATAGPEAVKQGGAPGALCTLEARGEGDSIMHASCNHCASALLPRCTPPTQWNVGTSGLGARQGGMPRAAGTAASTAGRGRVPQPRGRPWHRAAPPSPEWTAGRQALRAALPDTAISNRTARRQRGDGAPADTSDTLLQRGALTRDSTASTLGVPELRP